MKRDTGRKKRDKEVLRFRESGWVEENHSKCQLCLKLQLQLQQAAAELSRAYVLTQPHDCTIFLKKR